MAQHSYPTVAVLMGGPSREHAVSLKTGQAISTALSGAGCTVYPIVFTEAILPQIPTDCDVVFPALHGFFGEDGQIQRLLEDAGHSYVGCDSVTSALIIDKAAFKTAILRAGARSPQGFELSEPVEPFPEHFSLPIIVKPNREGSTIGLTLVENENDWPAALRDALACDKIALVEAFIPGIECTVPVLDGKALPMVEIIPPGGLFDHDAKYAQTRGETIYNCPPKKISDRDQIRAAAIAEAIYHTVSARDMLRVDMILNDDDSEFYVLEGNSLPGFTATSLMPKSAAAVGIPFADLCLHLVRTAYIRGHS